jgi:hypothetical protein
VAQPLLDTAPGTGTAAENWPSAAGGGAKRATGAPARPETRLCGGTVNPRHLSMKSASRLEQPSTFFTMNCLLCSRTELGIVSGRDSYVQDVDVYLDQLLATFADPEVFERTRRYLSKYDSEVFKRLRRSEVGQVRYRILRTPADFLLLSACTFATPPMRRGRSKQEPIEEGYIGKGKTYYHFAYSYSQRLHRTNTIIIDVLEKLSLGFDRYARILSHMRGEPKEALLQRLATGEQFILERVVNREQEAIVFEEKQDSLLDAISEYGRTGSDETRAHIARLVADLAALRPDFHFDLARLGLAGADHRPPGLKANDERP